jgi:hypothetical protein
LIVDVNIAAYAPIVVAVVLAATIVAVAPCIHVNAADAPAFASVDDVVVSYRS